MKFHWRKFRQRSRAYAFDNFVHNADRHAGNFLVVKQRTAHAVMAFDYSRAWLVNGFPLPNLPFSPAHNTLKVQRQLTIAMGKYIDPSEARKFLDNLRLVSKSRVERIIDDHPDGWLTAAERAAICGWWGTQPMHDRIDQISKGIDDGTYL